MPSTAFDIPVERIHLYEENPRHGAVTDPTEIVKILLEDEQVYELAKSIAEHRTNPLELLGVVDITEEGASEPSYEVWEGNRRVAKPIRLQFFQSRSSAVAGFVPQTPGGAGGPSAR